MYIKSDEVKKLNANLDHFGLAGTMTSDLLIKTLLPVYSDVKLLTAKDEFYLKSLNTMCDILINTDMYPKIGFIPEMLIALGFINIRYSETPRILARVLGIPTASTGLIYEKYDKVLRSMHIYSDKVYQFLLDIHTCGMAPSTTTMAGKNDVRHPSLIRDAWMCTLLNPDTFCRAWSTDYMTSNVSDPTPDNLINAIHLSWVRAKNLFGKNGTYKILTDAVKNSHYWRTRINTLKFILEDEDEYNKRTSVETYYYIKGGIQ